MKFYDTLPAAAHEAASNFLIRENHPVKTLGFICQDMGYSEVNIYLNSLLADIGDKDAYFGFCLFQISKDVSMPLRAPCPVYDASETSTFYFETIVGIDLLSWTYVVDCPAKNKFIYVYDTILAGTCPKEIIAKINEAKIKIIARNNEQIKFLKLCGYANISKVTIEYLDLSHISKIRGLAQ